MISSTFGTYRWIILLTALLLGFGISPARSADEIDDRSARMEYGGAPTREEEPQPQTQDTQMQAERHASPGMGYLENPNVPPSVRRRYNDGHRYKAEDFIDSNPNEGSLWVLDGQENYYFTKNPQRSIGDIITVMLEEGSVREALQEVKRTLTPMERKAEIAYAQEKFRAKAYNLPAPPMQVVPGSSYQAPKEKDEIRSVASAAEKPEASKDADGSETKDLNMAAKEKIIKVQKATLNDVDITPFVALKSGDPLMAEIVERYPNGNFKIRGTRRIAYRNGYRLITLLGVVRGSDINESNDTVLSGKLYEYRLNVLR